MVLHLVLQENWLIKGKLWFSRYRPESSSKPDWKSPARLPEITGSGKKFIENFVNYAGRIDVDLNFKNSGVYGICTAKKLSANAVWFNIPLYFEKAVFNFKGKTVTSDADGLLGGEKVNHILNITHLGTSEKEVYGELNTTLHGNFKYIPDLTILNSADAKIVYKIKHKKIDVMYLLKLKEGSDLLYKKPISV